MNQDTLIGKGMSGIACPVCSSKRVSVGLETESFEYGTGKDAVTLSAKVPLYTCEDCSFQFTTALAEDRRHEAVCKHLGILSPKQIVSVRENIGMTRAAFCELTSLGEASLGRWERGAILQNKAYDNLLRLLMYQDNVQRLKTSKDIFGKKDDAGYKNSGIFDALEPESLENRKKSAELFEMHPTGTGLP